MEHSERSLYGELASCCLRFRVDEQTSRKFQASADFEFPASYIGFDGHFPGRPVLPAIVQLAMVRYLSEGVLGIPLVPLSWSKTKFRGMVQPGERVVVSIDLDEKERGWDGTFTLKRAEEELVATGFVYFLVTE